MTAGEGVAIWWIRRDLRLSDNEALAAALASATCVVPVFVLDPAILSSPNVGPKRVALLHAALRSLDADLRARGSRLTVRKGEPARELTRLAGETGASGVFAEADFSPYARARDARVGTALPLGLVGSPTLRHPDLVVTRDGNPHRMYATYSRAWLALPLPSSRDLLPSPQRLPEPPALASLDLPAADAPPSSAVPTEEAGQRLLRAIISGPEPPIYRYAADRDSLDLDATSRLSPYLRFGLLSGRQVIAAALAARDAAANDAARDSADAWLRELIWREFSVSLLYHFPEARLEPQRHQARGIAWNTDEEAFAAWCEGRTGYPIVDAAMRQLAATGWLHNRARMIAASFLVKHLLIDWRRGERWFMQHLLDGDPAANNANWQWIAGTSIDSAPYFRILNPITQARRYAAEGTYIRAWLPELGRVPRQHLAAPWLMSCAEQQASSCTIGRDYPAPIVDHARARARALAAYRAAATRAP